MNLQVALQNLTCRQYVFVDNEVIDRIFSLLLLSVSTPVCRCDCIAATTSLMAATLSVVRSCSAVVLLYGLCYIGIKVM